MPYSNDSHPQNQQEDATKEGGRRGRAAEGVIPISELYTDRPRYEIHSEGGGITR